MKKEVYETIYNWFNPNGEKSNEDFFDEINKLADITTKEKKALVSGLKNKGKINKENINVILLKLGKEDITNELQRKQLTKKNLFSKDNPYKPN